MDSQVVDKISEDPDAKRQKLETDEKCEKMSPSSESSLDYDSDDVRLFEQEHKRSGDYDFDSTKVGRLVGFHPVVFDDCTYADEPETDGDLMERLSKIALKKYNDDEKKTFELVRVVKANWNLGGGNMFSITLEAKDASHSQPITFQAKVRYLPGGTRVFDVNPKP